MKKDLQWLVNFLKNFNGVVMFDDSNPKLQVFVDASLTGMGAHWGNNVYAISRHLQATAGLNINQLEMLNVLIALRTFAKVWANQRVEFNIDNKAVVFALNKGQIRDHYMQAIARSVWLVSASQDIKLSFKHVFGVDNGEADKLSRVFERSNNDLTPFKSCVWWLVNGYHSYPNTFV